MARLPVIQDQPAPVIRPSRAGRRRAAVLIGVHLLIAAHIAHWLVAGSTVTPVEPSEAMAFSRGGVINAGLIFFAAAILLTAVFGRWFCGWGCHLVALQDLCRWLLGKLGIRPHPLRSRLLAWVPALAFVYMFLWPAAYRLWVGDSFRHVESELTTSDFWATFPGWVVGGLTFVVCGFVCVYFLGAKGFCTYACPYGAAFAAADRLSPMRIRVTDACAGCGHCTAVCSSNVRVHEEVRDYGMVVDPGCMKCRDCVSVCPNDALYYGRGPIALGARPLPGREASADDARRRRRPLPWSEEAVLAVAFALAFFSFRGLYRALPFLLSLGVAGVLAYGSLFTARVLRRPDLSRLGFRLKRGGRLQPAGWAFLAAMALVAAFWAHSATVRWHDFRGEAAYRQVAALAAGALDVAAAPPALTADERRTTRRALDHLQRVGDLGLFPTRGAAAQRARLHRLLGQPAAMRQQAALAAARGEQPAQMYQLVGLAAFERGDLPAAVAAFERAISAAPSAPGPYVNLGVLLARAGYTEPARQVFDRGLARLDASPELAYNAALIRALQGDDAAAAELFRQALELDPGYREARENLAGILARSGRYAESVEHYRRALEQAPDDVDTRLLLARSLAALGEAEAAAGEAREALRRQPGRADALDLLRSLGAPAEAAPAAPGNDANP